MSAWMSARRARAIPPIRTQVYARTLLQAKEPMISGVNYTLLTIIPNALYPFEKYILN
jgi:hypothetical protein